MALLPSLYLWVHALSWLPVSCWLISAKLVGSSSSTQKSLSSTSGSEILQTPKILKTMLDVIDRLTFPVQLFWLKSQPYRYAGQLSRLTHPTDMFGFTCGEMNYWNDIQINLTDRGLFLFHSCDHDLLSYVFLSVTLIRCKWISDTLTSWEMWTVSEEEPWFCSCWCWAASMWLFPFVKTP